MSYTKDSLRRMQLKAAAGYKQNRNFVKRLARLQPQQLDKLMLQHHTSEFGKINCTECANCCKTISPAIYESDINRMISESKMKRGNFIDQYLVPDEEGGYVFNQLPCPFLNSENHCQIYENRPKACREYPHTDRKRFYQILELTTRNSKTCPVVFNIIDNLKNSLF